MKKINLTGVVGWDFDAASVKEALSITAGEDIEVEISSPGGAVFEGIAIMNALRGYKGKVTTLINGLAASAASYIFLAGDERLATEGSFYMIHNATNFLFGAYQKQELERVHQLLSKIDMTIAGFYEKYTNIEDPLKKMENETFFTTDEMITDGIISKIGIASVGENSNTETNTSYFDTENQGGIDQMFENMTDKIRKTFMNANQDLFKGKIDRDLDAMANVLNVEDKIEQKTNLENNQTLEKGSKEQEEPIDNEGTADIIAEVKSYTETLANITTDFKTTITEMNAEFTNMKTEMDEMRKEFSEIKEARSKLNEEIENLKSEKEAVINEREKLLDEKQEKINNYFPTQSAENTNKWGAF